MSESALRIGFGEVEITPPTGLYMCGGLQPRTNVGTDDPLMAKALVATAGGKMAAIVGLDLIGLPRQFVDAGLADAAARTGIDPNCVIVSCSHTHSGPYTEDGLYSFGVINADYLATLPGAIATAIERACVAQQPATMHIGRAAVYQYLHHRRVVNKADGKAINTWMSGMTDDLDVSPQLLGTSGPIDPELWVLRFDDAEGRPFGAFVNFSLHVNTHFGSVWSADYPGVIASEMRRTFGSPFSVVFTPGACANVNTTIGGIPGWRVGAQYFADQAIVAARRAKAVTEPVAVGGAHREIAAPKRDPQTQAEGAIERLDWGGGHAWEEVFEPMLEHIGALPDHLRLPIAAVRLGPFALASNPGELFVEHGLTIKRRSPFPHTAVAELSNDIILYQPTREAFQQQGYETLVGANRVSMEGIELIVDTAVELLDELWQAEA